MGKKKYLNSARSLRIAEWCVMELVWLFPLFLGSLSEESNYLLCPQGVPGPGHSAQYKHHLIKFRSKHCGLGLTDF